VLVADGEGVGVGPGFLDPGVGVDVGGGELLNGHQWMVAATPRYPSTTSAMVPKAMILVKRPLMWASRRGLQPCHVSLPKYRAAVANLEADPHAAIRLPTTHSYQKTNSMTRRRAAAGILARRDSSDASFKRPGA
jgi:hypothetical protein